VDGLDGFSLAAASGLLLAGRRRSRTVLSEPPPLPETASGLNQTNGTLALP
jgi:hypothetical protein